MYNNGWRKMESCSEWRQPWRRRKWNRNDTKHNARLAMTPLQTRNGPWRHFHILIKWIIQGEFTLWSGGGLARDIETCHFKIKCLFCCFLELHCLTRVPTIVTPVAFGHSRCRSTYLYVAETYCGSYVCIVISRNSKVLEMIYEFTRGAFNIIVVLKCNKFLWLSRE